MCACEHGGSGVWMGVVCPCPPVRIDIVTLHNFLSTILSLDFVCCPNSMRPMYFYESWYYYSPLILLVIIILSAITAVCLYVFHTLYIWILRLYKTIIIDIILRLSIYSVHTFHVLNRSHESNLKIVCYRERFLSKKWQNLDCQNAEHVSYLHLLYLSAIQKYKLRTTSPDSSWNSSRNG